MEKSVYLQGNNIRIIEDYFFPNLPQLRWLDLRENNLISIPVTIKNHPSLETFLLEGNILVRLPIELGSLPKLKGLQVTNNPLEYPTNDILERGVQYTINFLRKEWEITTEEKESAEEKQHEEMEDQQKCEKKIKKNKASKEKNFKKRLVPRKHRRLNTTLVDIEESFQIRKLLQPNQDTALNLFEYWDRQTPSRLLEQLKHTHLDKYGKENDDEQGQPKKKNYKETMRHDLHDFGNVVTQKQSRLKRLREKLKTKEELEKEIERKQIERLKLLKRQKLLEKQEKILQRWKNKETLKKWQSKLKESQQRITSLQSWTFTAPYDTDPTSEKTIYNLGSTIERPEKIFQAHPNSAESFENNLTSLLAEFRNISFSDNAESKYTPRTEQKVIKGKMDKIAKIQNRLRELKLAVG